MIGFFRRLFHNKEHELTKQLRKIEQKLGAKTFEASEAKAEADAINNHAKSVEIRLDKARERADMLADQLEQAAQTIKTVNPKAIGKLKEKLTKLEEYKKYITPYENKLIIKRMKKRGAK